MVQVRYEPTRLLLTNQKTRISGVGRNQSAFVVAGRVKTVAGAPGDLVAFISHDTGRVAIPGRNRPDDFAGAIADEILFQHTLPPPGVYGAAAKNG